jgi:hypothetical protein
MFAILIAALLGQAAATPQAPAPAPVPDVRQLAPSAPKVVAEIDTVKVQGTPVGLAWSADGTIYLRVTQGKDQARHYQIATAPSLSVGQSDGAPVWAANYWNWKSGTAAPGDPTLKIDIEQHSERVRSVNTSSGGALAGMSSAALPGSGGGEGVSEGVAIAAANSAVTSAVVTMRFKGQVVGEWTNELPQPGMRYGWAPAPMSVLAYVDAEGRLALIDREGHKVLVPGATKAILPAWSMDGKQVIFLQKKSQTLYLLMTARVQ